MAGGNEDVLRYVSTTFPTEFMSAMFELWKSELFCDVQIIVEDKSYSAHRNVLAASSPYFRAMFESGMKEDCKQSVKLYEMNCMIFETILDFIYSGKVCVRAENCQELLSAADMLQITEVVTACCQYLEENLQPENCIGIYLFAESYSFEGLKKPAEEFIHNHYLSITQHDEFYHLPKDIFISFLQSENLHVETEYQVFLSALKWLLFDVSKRRTHVFEVMNPIRFPIIPEKQLDKCIEDCSDLSLRIALQKFLQDFKCDRRLCADLKLTMLKSYLLCPRRGARKNIFVIGGYTRFRGGRWSDSRTLSVVEQFDTFHQEWSVLPRIHHARSGLGIAVCKGSIYVAGGESDSLILDSLECYDPEMNRWTLLADMTTPRCAFGLVCVNECLYALGGWVGTEIGHTVERYDPRTNHWKTVTRMITLRYTMGIVEHEGLIYLIGGMSDIGELKTVESYNPALGEWTKLKDMQVRRAYVGVAVLDGYIYAVGGWNEHKGSLCTVEKYDPDKDAWEEVQSMNSPRAGPCVAAVNGILYVIGGRLFSDELSAPVTLKSVECYDPSANSWMEINDMPTSRCEGGIAVL